MKVSLPAGFTSGERDMGVTAAYYALHVDRRCCGISAAVVEIPVRIHRQLAQIQFEIILGSAERRRERRGQNRCRGRGQLGRVYRCCKRRRCNACQFWVASAGFNQCVIINAERTPYDEMADAVLSESISAVLPAIVKARQSASRSLN